MSENLNFLRDAVANGLKKIETVRLVAGGVQVTTHCMYPSGGLVRVMIRGGTEIIVASDEGEAAGEALSAGIRADNVDRFLAPFAKAYGIKVKEGIFHTGRVGIEESPLAVLAVANAARDAAAWLYEKMKLKKDRDFRKLLSDYLLRTFDSKVEHNKFIVGASNKLHRFANLISLDGGIKIIIDPVANDASSINARVVANMDVKSANNPNIEQRIVYDDEDDWSAADLNLLQIGATVVPFSRAPEVIGRITRGAAYVGARG